MHLPAIHGIPLNDPPSTILQLGKHYLPKSCPGRNIEKPVLPESGTAEGHRTPPQIPFLHQAGQLIQPEHASRSWSSFSCSPPGTIFRLSPLDPQHLPFQQGREMGGITIIDYPVGDPLHGKSPGEEPGKLPTAAFSQEQDDGTTRIAMPESSHGPVQQKAAASQIHRKGPGINPRLNPVDQHSRSILKPPLQILTPLPDDPFPELR